MSRDQIGIGSSDWQEQQQWAAAGFGDIDINAVHHWKKNSWTPWTWHEWQRSTDPVDDLEQRLASYEKQLTEARERIERQGDLIARMQRQIEALQSLALPQAEATPNSCKKQAEATPNSCEKSRQFTSVRDEFWRGGRGSRFGFEQGDACLF